MRPTKFKCFLWQNVVLCSQFPDSSLLMHAFESMAFIVVTFRTIHTVQTCSFYHYLYLWAWHLVFFFFQTGVRYDCLFQLHFMKFMSNINNSSAEYQSGYFPNSGSPHEVPIYMGIFKIQFLHMKYQFIWIFSKSSFSI
jgi:hypothetical protein